jgi:hypothetical protein
MIEPGSDEWLAQVLKKRETEFSCKLRTRQVLPVASTAQAVVERILDDPVISRLIDYHEYSTVHFREKGLRFRQRQDFTAMLPRLAKESRAFIGLGNDSLTFGCDLRLNCDNTLVKEKVEGKQRQVPNKADFSHIVFEFSGASYCTPAFLEPFLRLVGDCFGIIEGDYGWARNLWLDVWTNKYDNRYGDLFAPQFLTWANLIGPRHVAGIGRERFHSAPAHSCVDLPGGGIVLTVCADPRDVTTPKVQDTVARVKKHLGILSPSERASPEELAAFEAEMQVPPPQTVSPFAEAFRQADEQTPGEMVRQAAGTVEGVKQFWNATLDYTPASVSAIDGLILTGFRQDEEEDDIETAVQAFGAYLGECVRRHFGGTWHDEEMKGQPVLLDVGPKRQRITPFRAVRQRFEKRENGIPLQEWYRSIGQ